MVGDHMGIPRAVVFWPSKMKTCCRFDTSQTRCSDDFTTCPWAQSSRDKTVTGKTYQFYLFESPGGIQSVRLVDILLFYGPGAFLWPRA
jgi:hypothetical protein